MQPEVMVVGGLFDNLLKSLIQMPDFVKADKPLLKSGVGNVLDSLKPTTNAIGGMILDAAKTALLSIIDSWTPSQVLVVGASPEAMTEMAVSGAKKKRSKEDVEAAIIAEGGDPAQFAPWLLLLLQFAPQFLEIIKKLLNK